MTIDEALQDITDIMNTKKPLKDKDYYPALRLGIEALKLLRWIRDGHIPASDFRLPGETED